MRIAHRYHDWVKHARCDTPLAPYVQWGNTAVSSRSRLPSHAKGATGISRPEKFARHHPWSLERRSTLMSQPPDRPDPSSLLDPFGFWKQSQQAMLESWSKTMNEAVNSAPYAESTGRMLDSYLTVSAPLRKIIDQTMTQLLNQLSLPSRGEVVSLAERMTNIELRLDDLDARLDDILRGVERTASAVAALTALTTSARSGDANGGSPNGTRTKDRTPERPQDSASNGSAPAQATRTTRTTRAAGTNRAGRASQTTSESATGSATTRRATARSPRKIK